MIPVTKNGIIKSVVFALKTFQKNFLGTGQSEDNSKDTTTNTCHLNTNSS